MSRIAAQLSPEHCDRDTSSIPSRRRSVADLQPYGKAEVDVEEVV